MRVRVETRDGRVVRQWDEDDDGEAKPPPDYALAGMTGPVTHVGAGSFMAGLRRSIRDARILDRGGDPERPSEKVMRMLSESPTPPHEG